MPQYEWFTKLAALQHLSAKGEDALSRNLAGALRSSPNALDDDPIVLIAFENQEIAGWIRFTYGYVSDQGVLVRIAAAQNLFTDQRFRGAGIGTTLIKQSLQVPLPCIYSGISAAAMPLYEKLGFSFIHRWPVFRLPLSTSSAIRTLRDIRAQQEKDGKQGWFPPVRALVSAKQSVSRTDSNHWQVLEPEDALRAFEALATTKSARFQFPWNRRIVFESLKRTNDAHLALVLENKRTGRGEKYFVSLYCREADVRIPFTDKKITFSDAHLNEIYPPLTDSLVARELVAAVARQASSSGIGCLSIYGHTRALVEACESLKIHEQGKSSFAIRARTSDVAFNAAIENPANWWCRALNEDQFEEARQDADLIVS